MKTIFRIVGAVILATFTFSAQAAEPAQSIRDAHITGGLIAQIGSDSLALKELGERFHVRLLLPDAAAVAKGQAAIDQAGLQGRLTVTAWQGGHLPFNDRVLNALVLGRVGLVSEEEIERVIAPGGLLISPEGIKVMPVSQTIDDWTHYFYDASGNAVSKDQEVAPPRSFRWWAEPLHLRSHNYSSSFTGLVTAKGRAFHFIDEGTYLFPGGGTDRWSVVARDAFNGALLWKRPLHGYAQPYWEDQAGQAVPDAIWRTPQSLNRRMVVQGDKLYVALHYRQGPLSVLDAASGETLREIDLGGAVDEIVAEGDLVVCRVRSEIPMPRHTRPDVEKLMRELREQGMGVQEARGEMSLRIYDELLAQKESGEQVVGVDAVTGEIRWRYHGPLVAVTCLAMAEGKVVYYNYQDLVALDASSGQELWKLERPNPRGIGARNQVANLFIDKDKVLFSGARSGGLCLNLADGKELWQANRMPGTPGFGYPTALRAVNGVIYNDMGQGALMKDGSSAPFPDIGDMQKRGHHVRCHRGKATERYLITPMRGVEFVDLVGDDHMPCDWIRGACAYGVMPANGLLYVTPDPCSCYAGARIIGFFALSAGLPAGLEQAPAPDAQERLAKGPAYGTPLTTDHSPLATSPGWPNYMRDARRTSFAGTDLSANLTTAWTRDIGGELTQATIADGRAYLARKDNYQLISLDLADGKTVWARSFPAALDGPPTIVGGSLFIGCRDGSVYSLRAADGELAWRYQAAPLDRLTLHGDRLDSVWPVSSSVLYHNGLIYAVAGRNSYLDGGIRLVALEPASGLVRHHSVVEGPWPSKKDALVAVRDEALPKDPQERATALERISQAYATGYGVKGAEADLLVSDGTDLYMTQAKFDRQLKQIPLQRTWSSGWIPMGGQHMLANFGLLNDTMFHRQSRAYDDGWPAYGSGPASGARYGSLVVVGSGRAYAAHHFTGGIGGFNPSRGGYAGHNPGAGNRIVADDFATENLPGGRIDLDEETRNKEGIDWTYFSLGDKSISRTRKALWTTSTPVIVRALLGSPDGQGGELVFAAGVVEGKTVEEWDKSTYFEGPGKLQVFNGADGKLLAEYDLPACPVFDGLSTADGRLLIPMVNGQVQCLVITQ